MKIRTPYYLFDRSLFVKLLHSYLDYGQIFYPIKANDDKLIISELKKYNCGFEVDSIKHIKLLVKKHGVSPSKILYSYPIREIVDIKNALDLKIKYFVIDSFEEYNKISMLSRDANFFIRLNILSIVKNDLLPKYNKWGLSIKDVEKLILKIKEDNNKFAGLSFYITSEINSTDAFVKVLESITDNFSQYKIDFINIGGGISLECLDKIKHVLFNVINKLNVKHIIMEPGRHLLNPCIDMVVSVTSIRSIGETRLVYINSGIYFGLIDAVIKDRKYLIVDKKQTEKAATVPSIICGSSSDISDTLGKYNLRDDLKVGDSLIIKECGAYSAVMQTNFYGKPNTKMKPKV